MTERDRVVRQHLDAAVGALVERRIRRVHVLAWRDLDDPDAGGSEVHADEFMRRWAERGLDVTHRTSSAAGRTEVDRRNGYRVVRRGTRYSVFPRAIVAEVTHRMGRYDALVEIWNGVPWLSPIWCRQPRITVLHHIHGPMWDQILPGPLASFGRTLEARLAPPFYRSGLTVVPSEATRDELLALRFRADRVRAFPNGVDARFMPGGARTPEPSLVAVGRLAPVKRFDLVITAAVEAHRHVPGLTLTIVGEGPLRDELLERIRAAGATDYIRLAGRVDDDELIGLYRSAWLVVSGSLAEGWGLSLTEGAACGTPSVATDISGHRSSVDAGVSGDLVPPALLGDTIAQVLTDTTRLDRLRRGALDRAATLSWDASALGVTRALLDEVRRRSIG